MIFRNMRVPETSVIHSVYTDGLGYSEADENLDMWESSSRGPLGTFAVKVKARRSWHGFEALITPLSPEP